MLLIAALAAAGCAQHPQHGPAPAGAVSAAVGDASPPAFTYPESAANGWAAPGSECPNAGPAGGSESTPPIIQQSPIDFTSSAIAPVHASAAVSVFLPGNFDGHDNNIVFASPLELTLNGKLTYTPLGFHFHSPVEHTLPAASDPGSRPPQLEMHIKAAEKSGRVVVFAVQYQASMAVSMASPTLDALYDSMVNGTRAYQGVSLFETLNLFRRIPFYGYVGSLTTPPCTTGVQFYVAAKPEQIPPAQMAKLLAVLRRAGMPDPNNRFPRQLTVPAPVVTLFNALVH